MAKNQSRYFSLIVLVATLLGCNLSSALIGDDSAQLESLATRTPLPTFTSTAASESGIVLVTAIPVQPATPTPPNTPTPQNTATVLPSPTPPPANTPTVENKVVMATVQENMNVRSGPGTNYLVIGSATANNSSKVLGRNKDSSWIQVEYPSKDGKAWVLAQLVTVTGDLNTVAVVEAPPPPVVSNPNPAPKPTSNKKEQPTAVPAPKFQFTPNAWYASENAGIVQVKGRIKDGGGNLVNGFSILADNGSFKVLSHPTGASRWYPDKGDGEWDIVFPNIRDAQGWWTLTVVLYGCNFAGGFDAQCKTYTKFSEDIRVEIATPKESIINADWVCHWDCNKGLYSEGYRKPK